MASLIPPLSSQVEIVDEQGKPTPYFMRILGKLGVGSGLSKDSSGNITMATMAAKTILANKTSLTSSPTSCAISDILDFVSTTRGTILFRGATGWQALAPGTAGQFLKTAGAGADPSWSTGGGGSAWDFQPPLASSFSLVSGDTTQLALTDDSDVGLIASYNSAGLGGQVQRCALRTLTNKTLDWTLTIKMKSLIPSINFRGNGILLYDSISANNIGFELTTDSGLRIAKWTNLLGAGGVNLTTTNITAGTYIEWLRVVHTGGNYIFYMSENGKLWVEHSRVVDTAQMANRADKVGFSTYNWNTGAVTQMTVPYFTLTGPGV